MTTSAFKQAMGLLSSCELGSDKKRTGLELLNGPHHDPLFTRTMNHWNGSDPSMLWQCQNLFERPASGSLAAASASKQDISLRHSLSMAARSFSNVILSCSFKPPRIKTGA